MFGTGRYGQIESGAAPSSPVFPSSPCSPLPSKRRKFDHAVSNVETSPLYDGDADGGSYNYNDSREILRLRNCPPASLDVRSARARGAVQGELEKSLLHRGLIPRQLSKRDRSGSLSRRDESVSTWAKQRVSWWQQTGFWDSPDPMLCCDWEDDQSRNPVIEGKVRKQLERWSVRCPLCLLYRDVACDDHPLTFCPRIEARRARFIRARLVEEILELQTHGIKGYGPVPWCGDCCLPRSCCSAWSCQDETDRTSYWEPDTLCPSGDVYACRSWLAQKWSRRDGSRCQFREVVVNGISAMCAFSLSPNVTDYDDGTSNAGTFWDVIQDWRNGSRIRFNECWGTDGWLLSPMPWGDQDVMVMLRIFCQLDVVVENLWVDKELDKRRQDNFQNPDLKKQHHVIEHEDRAQFWRPDDNTAAATTGRDVDLSRDLQEALDKSKKVRQSYIFCGSSYFHDLGARVRAWRRGGIRCQLCMMHQWSEACYLHDMASCTLHNESEVASTLLRQWSGLRGGEGGVEKDAVRCKNCRFPKFICRFTCIGITDCKDDDCTCQLVEDNAASSGIEIVCRTVAALLTIANGVLGNLIIQEEMVNNQWSGNYQELSREWMQEQVPISESHSETVPRIARIFQRGLDGLEGLKQVN